MNTLITGGTGFIGRALVGKLFENGNKVILLTREVRKVDNFLKEKAEVLEADMCNLTSLGNLNLEQRLIDVLIHLAASLGYFGDKRKLFQVNVKGTENLLHWAEKNRLKKFIFISSIEAMGTIREEDIPADETFVCKPVSTYGESKLEAEKRIRRFADERNLNIPILRLGNVYGPGSPAFIMPIANAILKKDMLLRFLPVYKDRYLHPVYIDDVVDGIVKVAQKNDIDKTYILAGEKYVTIETLFKLIAQSLNVDIDLQTKKKNLKDMLYLNFRKKVHQFRKKADLLTYFMAGEGERIHRAYSIEKAKKELGYSPKVNLKEGIAKTLDWATREGLLAIKEVD